MEYQSAAAAFIDHRDAGGHGHGFRLVVGHVDEGGLQLLVQLADVGAGFHAQLGIQVGERLIEEENFWLAHDGPTDSHTLALATGELAGLAVEQVFDAQDLSRILNPLLDFCLWGSCAVSGRTPYCRYTDICGYRA